MAAKVVVAAFPSNVFQKEIEMEGGKKGKVEINSRKRTSWTII